MENINSWQDLQWASIEVKVFRLQLRIYKAAANQELEKVHKIQKLLISSKSAKYLAVRRVTEDSAGKRTPGVDTKKIFAPEEKFTLANQLKIDGKSCLVQRTSISKSDGSKRPLGIPTITDRAKQTLAYLALSPEWEAQFEAQSYGFRPGRSVADAMEAVFLGIFKKPKWVLDADIAKSFDSINHKYLLEKCQTFPEMEKQLRAWLRAGILEEGNYAFPELGTPQGGPISALLVNIALHGLHTDLDEYINKLPGHKANNRQSLTYVRYADNFLLMYPDKTVIEDLKIVTEKFLEPIGLQLHPTKTRILYTLNSSSPGLTFLGFDVFQKPIWSKMRIATKGIKPKQKFITLIKPSKDSVQKHKLKIRDTIRRFRGISQKRLIQNLNPIIRGWALSKRTQISSQTFQTLDTYLFIHLWKWARKRHPKMAKLQLKSKYWHSVNKSNWIFGIKTNDEITLRLQMHTKIYIQRHAKVKGTASPFDGNLIYWATRTGKNPLIPPIKARLIQDQKGRCGICGNLFLPDDIIETDYIVPKALGGANIRKNVSKTAVHHYCHLIKTKDCLAKRAANNSSKSEINSDLNFLGAG